MTLDEAFKTAIQQYFSDEQFDSALDKQSPRKYNKDYFNQLQSDLIPSQDQTPVNPKDKKGKKKNAN